MSGKILMKRRGTLRSNPDCSIEIERLKFIPGDSGSAGQRCAAAPLPGMAAHRSFTEHGLWLLVCGTGSSKRRGDRGDPHQRVQNEGVSSWRAHDSSASSSWFTVVGRLLWWPIHGWECSSGITVFTWCSTRS
jgi:hypothetical protein